MKPEKSLKKTFTRMGINVLLRRGVLYIFFAFAPFSTKAQDIDVQIVESFFQLLKVDSITDFNISEFVAQEKILQTEDIVKSLQLFKEQIDHESPDWSITDRILERPKVLGLRSFEMELSAQKTLFLTIDDNRIHSLMIYIVDDRHFDIYF